VRAGAVCGGQRPGRAGELPGPLASVLAAPRFQLVPCDAPLYSVRELFAFRGAADRFGLDLLHFPHYVRAFAPGCPVAVTIHDAIHLSHPPSLAAAGYARVMLSWSARTAAVLFTPTAAARDDIAARLGVDSSRFTVTPNGVESLFSPPADTELAEFRRSRELDTDYVLCVGTHRRHKNLAAAVAAFVAAGLEGASMVIPARGEREAAALAASRRAGVRVLPDVRDADLPLLYAGARFVLAPSLVEGFGLAPLEAAACGAAVLASDIAAHREVLGESVAWFAPSTGVSGLAAAIGSLWRDDPRRAELRARGPIRARRFDWATTARLTLAGYRRAAPIPA